MEARTSDTHPRREEIFSVMCSAVAFNGKLRQRLSVRDSNF